LFRNVNWAPAAYVKVGESNTLSLRVAGSLTHAALGSESAGGVGSPESDVCHNMGSTLMMFIATQPAGSIGGVTLSKYSLKTLPTTLTEAMALPPLAPGQPLPIVNEAVLLRVEPQVAVVVALITWAWVVVLPGSVLRL
jgi:hypothetical protein